MTKNGKPVLKKYYSILQDDFFNHMRSAGYTDVERGELGSTEEHLTVTQFKVQAEQERLADLTQQAQQKEQRAAVLDKKIEKVQKQQLAIQAVDQITPTPVPLSSKVMLDRSEYETLATSTKKYITQEKRESKLQKALAAANKLIAELKAKVASLTAELSELKSVRGRLRTSELEQENAALRKKVQGYESVIDRQNLWHLFGKKRLKTPMRDDLS